MSTVSKQYDIGKKGFLTDEERQARALDVDGEGKIPAASAVKLAEQNAALQAEVRTLKRRQLALYFVAQAAVLQGGQRGREDG